jgi:hypothetical protein
VVVEEVEEGIRLFLLVADDGARELRVDEQGLCDASAAHYTWPTTHPLASDRVRADDGMDIGDGLATDVARFAGGSSIVRPGRSSGKWLSPSHRQTHCSYPE